MTSDQQKPSAEYWDAWLALTRQTAPPSKPVSLPMLSGSMAPAIPAGALLEIVVRPEQACRAGDVAIFERGDKLVAHRVLLVLGFGSWRVLLEKGDANPGGRWCSVSAVRGRVTGYRTSPDHPRRDPADPGQARLGRRRHLRHWLSTLGGLRRNRPGEENHE